MAVLTLSAEKVDSDRRIIRITVPAHRFCRNQSFRFLRFFPVDRSNHLLRSRGTGSADGSRVAKV